MRRIRVIPTLLLEKGGLVKTVRFRKRKYVGDPINTVKILNDKEVDELIVLDIIATREGKSPDISLISKIASECFMPVAYGGGISDLSQIKEILNTGVEKVILNTALLKNPKLIRQAADIYGSQSIAVSIDAKRSMFFGKYQVMITGGAKKAGIDPVRLAVSAVEHGAGEIMINSVDQDGMQNGYDIDLIKSVAEAVSVPVIACGGAATVSDFVAAIQKGKASAVAAGSLFVFKGPHRAVLVNYPCPQVLTKDVYELL